MYDNETRRKLQNIVSGIRIEGETDNCTTARNYLCASFSTGTTVKTDFENRSKIKEKQRKQLKEFAINNNFWLTNIDASNTFFAKGGEAKVFLENNGKNVLKINTGIYYNTWLDFLNSILIHNLLFKDAYYSLTGFIEIENELNAVLQQPFILSNESTNLTNVKNYLEFNGFINTRRNDYYNKELGLILEDIHDENVITQNSTLFFIDTVFYINIID